MENERGQLLSFMNKFDKLPGILILKNEAF
jgi:hypothetical protein